MGLQANALLGPLYRRPCFYKQKTSGVFIAWLVFGFGFLRGRGGKQAKIKRMRTPGEGHQDGCFLTQL